VSDPFGAPPEDMVNIPVPSESDDPYRPIGTTGADGKFAPGKLKTIGRCIGLVQEQKAKGPCLKLTWVVTEGDFAGREFELFVSFSPAARFKVVETYNALGLPLDGTPYPKSQVVGAYATLNLEDEEYNGRWSAKLKGIEPHPKGVGYRGAAELS
jgi:hypothetical protein